MDAHLIKRVKDKEKELLPVLYDKCRNLFSRCHLPSHDHCHHLRVWNYARDLLFELPGSGNRLSRRDISLLMLAVFFHDTGMTKSLDEDHGRESRLLCEQFLLENPEVFSFDAGEALEAIELHDKKEIPVRLKNNHGMNLLNILSVCDDLDAYGYIGILRYAEIYILRGVALTDLAGRVIRNITFRFGLLEAQKWIPELFLTKQRARYMMTFEFYEKMTHPNPTLLYEKYCNILESYMKDVYRGKIGIGEWAGKLINSDDRESEKLGISLLAELRDNSLTCR